jgi:hypothetical protein
VVHALHGALGEFRRRQGLVDVGYHVGPVLVGVGKVRTG